MSKVFLTLPWPPSANRLWRSVRGHAIKSRPYRAWEEIAAPLLKRQLYGAWLLPAPYRVSLVTYQPSARKLDIDNRFKATIDLIFHIIGMDDCLIDSIRIDRGPIDRKNPRVEVTIETLTNGGAS